MVNGKTQLMTSGQGLGKVEIKWGIFQGDSLSPSFVLCMIPLTLILRKTGNGDEWISHIVFMIDLKSGTD